MSNPEQTTKVYTGWVRLAYEDGQGPDDILFVVPANTELYLLDEDDTLARKIEEDIESHGRYLSVRYFASDVEADQDALQAQWLTTLMGTGSAEYYVHYSECTGYLWTDEEITVGGHDLLGELKSHEGKYLRLEIDYRKDPRPQ